MSSISSRRRPPTRRTCSRVAVALLELRLGLEVAAVLVVDVLLVLGEAEVLKRAVPGVSESHEVNPQ